MINRVCILLLFAFLSVQNGKSDAQQMKASSLNDSLIYLLNYFDANTGNTAFKQALQRSMAINAAGGIPDSLAGQLIHTQDLLLQIIRDSALLNRHPFNEDMVFGLSNSIVNLCQNLPPRKENMYYAAAISNLGMTYIRKLKRTMTDEAKALDLFKKALAIRERVTGKENPDYANNLFYIGQMYSGMGEAEKGLSMMLRAMAILKQNTGDENAGYADNLFSLATFCKEQKKYDSALLLHEQEINIRKKISGENNSAYAFRLYLTGEMLMYIWQYQKAFAYYQQALTITGETAGKENIQYAHCLEGIAGYYYTTADYDKALPLYFQSLAIKEKLYGKENPDIALTMHNFATTYIKMGRYEQAIPCLQRALSINVKSPFLVPVNHAFELSTLASLYLKIGNYQKALTLYTQALNIPGYKQQGLRYAGTLNDMAALYAGLSENKQALFYLEQARSIIKNVAGERSPDHANALYNISSLYEKLNRYATAMELSREALLIRKKFYGEAHPLYALSLCQLGSIYMDVKKMDSASICFTQALDIQKKALGEEHPDYIKTLNNLALSQFAERRNREAAFTVVKSNRLELRYIARTYTSLSEQEKMELENDQYYQFSYLPSLIYKNDMDEPGLLQQLYVNELTLKGMVWNDQQSLLYTIRNSKDTSAMRLYNEWRINKILIGRQLLKPINERSYNIDSVIETTNRMEQEFSRMSVSFRRQDEMPVVKNISDKLLQDEAAIEFIKFQYHDKKFTDSVLYAALIILPGDSIPAFVSLFEEKQLTNLLSKAGKNENAINRFYSERLSNDKESSGNALYSLIWKPLEKYLSGVHTVYYAPAGLLHRIAFQALPVDAYHFLIDRYSLNQTLSTRSVALPATVAQKSSMINIWGDINYDLKKDNPNNHSYEIAQRGLDAGLYGNTGPMHHRDTAGLYVFKWPELSGTRREMTGIKDIFRNAGIAVTTTVDSLATEDAFRSLDGKAPPLLHIATHGFFWPANSKLNNSFTLQQDPMFRSGLVLAGANEIWTAKKPAAGKDDGILTSYEIAQLDLSNTDLVVLSACETALGDLQDNEGVIGLQRAFKIAGVKQMVLSLWKVPDKETVELMTMFYKNLISGLSPAASLRAAQLKIKETYPPYYWAAFVLIE